MPNRKYTIKCLPYFMAKLAECAGDDLSLHWSTYPCLLWDRGLTRSGYGVIDFEGRTMRTNRLALIMSGVELNDADHACHHCDMPACFRRSHLFRGSSTDNVHDMMTKGRDRFPFCWQQPEVRRGERHAQAILTEAQVIEIRGLTGMSQSQIAARYGVSRGAISGIIQRRVWTHI
jgi:hypothetical protein